jgi:hypothetical protein
VVPRAGRGETPRRSWYHFGTGCIVHYVQIVHDVDTSDDLDAHGHIYTPIRSAGGRKVAGSNPAVPTTGKPALEAGFLHVGRLDD